MHNTQRTVGVGILATGILVLAAAGLAAGAPRVRPATVCGPCSVERIEAALVRLKGAYVSDPVVADAAFRRQIAAAIRAAADEHGVPALFLAGMFFRESSFRPAVIAGRRRGALGEVGLGQVHGAAAWWCRRTGYDLRTLDGQARCAAGWLARCAAACDGSLEQGFARYATGRSCRPAAAGATWRDRFALWIAMEEGTPIPAPPARKR
jgi:hypothetical protein